MIKAAEIKLHQLLHQLLRHVPARFPAHLPCQPVLMTTGRGKKQKRRAKIARGGSWPRMMLQRGKRRVDPKKRNQCKRQNPKVTVRTACTHTDTAYLGRKTDRIHKAYCCQHWTLSCKECLFHVQPPRLLFVRGHSMQ